MDTGPLFTGIPVLAPGEKRVISWGQFGGLMDHLGRDPVRVTTSFYRKNQSNRTDSPRTTVSFLEVASFETTDASDPPDVRQVRQLERIAASLVTGQRDLRTIAETLRTAAAMLDRAEPHSDDLAPTEESPSELPAVRGAGAKKLARGKAEKHGV
jgi:hypothetical protein